MKIVDRLPIGERIKYWRKKRGFTQADLARKLEISPVNISQIENGSRSPTISTLELIASALEVELSDLIRDPCSNETAIDIKKASTPPEKESSDVSDEDIKFALFGGDGEITDEMFEEVKRFAEFVKTQYKQEG